jgi:hypothetical protein
MLACHEVAVASIVLVSCVSKKLSYRARAEDLYVSPLFRLSMQYARSLSPERTYILSAKYGLLHLNDEIEPYDLTLNDLSSQERRAWAMLVMDELTKQCDVKRDHFVILAGIKYRQHLLPYLASYEVPMAGLPIGKQLRYLRQVGPK